MRELPRTFLGGLRRERHGFVALAVLVLVFQSLLPIAASWAGAGEALVASLCLGTGDDPQSPAGAHDGLCLCGTGCFHAGCGFCPAPASMVQAPLAAAAAAAVKAPDPPVRPRRLRPDSRAPPTFS